MITVTGKEMVQKIVSKHGTGGVVYVPKGWIGERVTIILEGKE